MMWVTFFLQAAKYIFLNMCTFFNCARLFFSLPGEIQLCDSTERAGDEVSISGAENKAVVFGKVCVILIVGVSGLTQLCRHRES